MAAFSSRGPSDDGRIKPDIVAPGTNIVSNASHAEGASSLWGQFETNADYAYSGGTSMATPLTAGAGVLVREWLVQEGISNPSAAAVKAALLNTTRDIAPGQYGTTEFQEIPFSRPNAVEGWGRVNLDFTNTDPPNLFWLDDHVTGLGSSQVVTYTSTNIQPLEVLTNTLPLRVMLAWTDPPASLSAASQLVNDLDLIVTGPGGVVYHANGHTTTFDRTNNVEGVVIDQPPLGEYTITVRAFNVPIDSQPYALAVWGPLRPNPPEERSVFLPFLIR
jgi:subtilisin family serine protease